MLFTGTTCLKDTNNTNNNTQNKLKLMMKTKFFYSKVMLLMLAMVLSAQGLWADTKDINVTDLSSLAGSNQTVTVDGWKFQIKGTASYDAETLTVNEHSQLIIHSDENTFSKVVFSSVTGAFNKCHNFKPETDNDYTSWVHRSDEGLNYENDMAITPKGGNATFSGTITITYTAKTERALKVTPRIVFSFYSEQGYPENANIQPSSAYTAPAVIIQDPSNSADLSKYFYLNYFIDGKSPAPGDLGYDKDKKEITTDDVTGTTIQRLYGGISVGDKSGVVTFNIAVLPKDDQASNYNMANEKFSFTIDQITGAVATVSPSSVTIPVSQNQWNSSVASSTPVAVPSATITKDGKDITDKYTVSVAITDGSSDIKFDNETTKANILSTKDYTSFADFVNANGKLTYTFTPKDPTTYGSIDAIEVPVSVTKLAEGTKVGVNLSFAGNSVFNDTDADAKIIHVYKWCQQYGSRYDGDIQTPVPVLTDQYGNIIENFNGGIDYEIIEDHADADACKDPKNDATDDHSELNVTEGASTETTVTSTMFQVWHPGYVVVRAKAYTYNPGSYNSSYDDTKYKTYFCDANGDVAYDDFKIIVHKRVPEIVLTPRLEDMHISQNTEWTPSNRIRVEAIFNDEYTNETDSLVYFKLNETSKDQYWYSFEFQPGSGIEVSNWNTDLADRAQIVYTDGTYKRLTASDFDDNRKINGITETTKDGKTVHTRDGKQIAWYQFYSPKGFGNETWKVKFTKSGETKFKYVIHPWNHTSWDISEQEFTVIVEEHKATTFDLTPTNFIAQRCAGSNFDEPQKHIEDATSGEDLTSKFEYTYSIEGSTEGDNPTVMYDATTYTHVATNTTVNITTGEVTIGDHVTGNEYDDVVIKVTATPTTEIASSYSTTNSTYTIRLVDCVNGGNPLYEVIDDIENNSDDSDHSSFDAQDVNRSVQEGKLHFITAGKIYGGTTLHGIPALNITIGKADFNNDGWSVKANDLDGHTDYTKNDSGNFDKNTHETSAPYISGDVVMLEGNSDIPTGGTYYQISPATNGFLDVDAKWEEGVSYVLVNKTANGSILKETFTATSTAYDNHCFRYALMAGNTYYLYAVNGDGILKVHGFSFQPGFLLVRTDVEPYHSATAFLSGIGESTYTEAVPTLINEVNDQITFASANTEYVDVNSTTGKLNIKKATTADNASEESRVRISARINSTISSTIHKNPYYLLYVSDIPTYVTSNGYKPSVDERISTTNHTTAIDMTFGGWKDGVGPYQTKKETTTQVIIGGETYNETSTTITDYIDSWKVAKMDSVGKDNRTIDGFKYGSQGGQNGKDEVMKSYPGTDNASTFDVPCRGTYVRFEPHENGKLVVYLMQSGICDYSVINPETEKQALKWRPIYIVDETGKKVTLAENTTMQGRSFGGSYSECLLRSPWNPHNNSDYFTWEDKFNGKTINGEDAKTFLQNKWKTLSPEGTATPSVLEAYETNDGGHIILTKGYMRYTFDVEAGKSYYVFSSTTKLFFDGFAFIPDGWSSSNATSHGNAVTSRTVTFDTTDGGSRTITYGTATGTAQTLNKDGSITTTGAASAKETDILPSRAPRKTVSITKNTNADITVNRNFTEGNWTSFCVPFSIGDTQFREVFGDGALIIGYDSLTTNKEAHFTQHVYHMVEAGRPYFIRPAKTVSDPVFKNVTVENVEPKTIEGEDFDFVGTYEPLTVGVGDYVFVGTKLYELTGAYNLKSYGAYLRGKSSSSKIMGFAFDNLDDRIFIDEEETVTGIERLHSDNVLTDGIDDDDNVYNIQGQVVRSSSTSLEGLPKGLYIVNGQKYVVR